MFVKCLPVSCMISDFLSMYCRLIYVFCVHVCVGLTNDIRSNYSCTSCVFTLFYFLTEKNVKQWHHDGMLFRYYTYRGLAAAWANCR